jgi:acyl-CoA oxidase
MNYDFETYKKKPLYNIASMITHGFMDMAAGTRIGAQLGLYAKSLISLGSKKHEKWIQRAFKMKDFGCFLLTEIGHGSNVQGILTNAVYDKDQKCFILHTHLNRGVKFWIGNLGETANMGVVFANLIVNGVNEGVHGFLVELRDKNGNFKPGVIIGDCGLKMGNNGIDNGWARFNSMKIGIDSLLDKYSWIDQKGDFKSKIKSRTKRFVVQISALSGGRLGIASSSCLGIMLAQGIALRYCTVRQQFGTSKKRESTLMEYPLVYLKIMHRLSNAVIYFQTVDLIDHECLHVDISSLSD